MAVVVAGDIINSCIAKVIRVIIVVIPIKLCTKLLITSKRVDNQSKATPGRKAWDAMPRQEKPDRGTEQERQGPSRPFEPAVGLCASQSEGVFFYIGVRGFYPVDL